MQQYRLFIDGHFPEPAINPSNALVMGLGTSTARAQANAANRNFLNFYLENYATSGDNRGMYLRMYHSGAGGGGEAARIFTTVNNVAAGTAHGAHVSLSFGTSGTVTGLGVAMRGTLHIANQATQAGTLSAIQAEVYSDGSTSDPAGSLLSFFRVVNGGDTTGAADVDDDAFLFNFDGFTAGAAHMWVTGLTAATVNAATTCALKIRVGATTYYIPVATAIT